MKHLFTLLYLAGVPLELLAQSTACDLKVKELQSVVEIINDSTTIRSTSITFNTSTLGCSVVPTMTNTSPSSTHGPDNPSSVKVDPPMPTITAPPQSSEQNDIPPKGSHPPEVQIILEDETYILPRTGSFNLLQSDGNVITLFPSQIVSGTATLSIPSLSGPTTLSAGGLTISAQPGNSQSTSSGGEGGSGGKGSDTFRDALGSLGNKAKSLADSIKQISDLGKKWASGSIDDASFFCSTSKRDVLNQRQACSGISGFLDDATNGLNDWVSSMNKLITEQNNEIYELTEDGPRRIFEARDVAVQALDTTRALRKLVRNFNNLKVETIVKLKDYWIQGTSAAVVLVAAEEGLRKYADFPWGTVVSPPTASFSSSSTSSSATPTPYLLTTKEGTDAATFKNFINSLPDGGDGEIISYPNLSWQSYVTNVTEKKAKDIANESFIQYVMPIVEDTSEGFGSTIPIRSMRQKRALGDLDRRSPSAEHLKLISALEAFKNADNSDLPPYMFDPVLGAGQTIYVIDSGLRSTHSEFDQAGRSIRTHVLSNAITLGLLPGAPASNFWAPEDMTDYTGHGTQVASAAVGKTLGVASKANLVAIKFRNAARNPFKPQDNTLKPRGTTQAAITAAWDWILNDVKDQRNRGNTGKFIINYSYGHRKSDHAGYEDLFKRVVNQAIKNDIIVVLAAGNEGPDNDLSSYTPQSMGTADNEIITVGATDKNGTLFINTTPEDGKGGSVTVFADGESVNLASKDDDSAKTEVSGTSFAAPQVAGLAAYLFSLESLNSEWHSGSAAKNIKKYIVDKAWQRRDKAIPSKDAGKWASKPEGSIKVIYNGAPDGLCSNQLGSQRRMIAERQNDKDGNGVHIMVNGKIVAKDLSISQCAASRTSSSEKASATSTVLPTSTSQPSSTKASEPSKPSYTGATPTATATSFACVEGSVTNPAFKKNLNTWGWLFYKDAAFKAVKAMCDSIDDSKPPILSRAIGAQPYHWSSGSKFKSPDGAKQGDGAFINIVVTAKDGCSVPLTRDYCRKSLESLVEGHCPGDKSLTRGGSTEDNCGRFFLTSGVEIQGEVKSNPLKNMDPATGWDEKYLCYPAKERCPDIKV